MEDQFVPYELAVKLKELGFDQDCLGTWELIPTGSDSSDIILNLELVCSNVAMVLCQAPLWQQVSEWFRCKGLQNILVENTKGYHYSISKGYYSFMINSKVYPTWEEARQACLEKLIEIVEVNNI